jgi:hypothetical protein
MSLSGKEEVAVSVGERCIGDEGLLSRSYEGFCVMAGLEGPLGLTSSPSLEAAGLLGASIIPLLAEGIDRVSLRGDVM